LINLNNQLNKSNVFIQFLIDGEIKNLDVKDSCDSNNTNKIKKEIDQENLKLKNLHKLSIKEKVFLEVNILNVGLDLIILDIEKIVEVIKKIN